MAKKHMRYMTRQFRKQIRLINEGLNTEIPAQIRQQETVSQRKNRLKGEILHKNELRYSSQHMHMNEHGGLQSTGSQSDIFSQTASKQVSQSRLNGGNS